MNALGQNEKVDMLRELILQSFPTEPYTGQITSYDDQLNDPELDEEKDLYDALKGRKWDEIPTEFLERMPDGYLLLSHESFAAFLPAWLMYSLESMESDNEVRNFLVYSFSSTMKQFRILNLEQRSTVRALLAEFAGTWN